MEGEEIEAAKTNSAPPRFTKSPLCLLMSQKCASTGQFFFKRQSVPTHYTPVVSF
jgi:hypothetical protein